MAPHRGVFRMAGDSGHRHLRLQGTRAHRGKIAPGWRRESGQGGRGLVRVFGDPGRRGQPHLRHPAEARCPGCSRGDSTLMPTLWRAGMAVSSGLPCPLREVLMRWIPIAAVILVLTSCGSDGPPWRDLGGICATPRAGIDRQGTLDDEKKFLRAWTDDLYLWYSEVPAIDSRNPDRTSATASTGQPCGTLLPGSFGSRTSSRTLRPC